MEVPWMEGSQGGRLEPANTHTVILDMRTHAKRVILDNLGVCIVFLYIPHYCQSSTNSIAS